MINLLIFSVFLNDFAVELFKRVRLLDLYYNLKTVPSRFIKVLQIVDHEMKISIVKKLFKKCSKKAYYTYLLIDDDKLKRNRAKFNDTCSLLTKGNTQDFMLFKSCIFYVGKGISDRKHQHLTLAKKLLLGDLPLKQVQLKVSKIASLWKQNKGVTLIQLDCDATTYEAFTRENCIIKSLNFNMLTNRIRGTSYGDAKYWPLIKIINYGDMLLYHLYRDFLGKEPNVLYSSDVVLKPKKTKMPTVCVSCKNYVKKV